MADIPEVVPYDPLDWEGIKVPKFRDTERCWKFMRKHGFHRLPPATERVFLRDIKKSIEYARRINSRLPDEFEQEIKKSPENSWEYVKHVIKVPIESFEPSLAKSPMILVNYSKEIVRGRLSEHLEDSLVGDPFACFEYAWQILDGRLPEKLHNYMFCASMQNDLGRRYRGYSTKLNEADEYSPDYVVGAQTYFDFIKWQRKNLHRQIRHYSEIYNVDPSRSVSDFLYELENGR
jgi:hypothetical protein